MAETFYEWLARQSDRNDAVADLANDVKSDKKAPVDSNSFDSWSTHLILAGASSVAHDALKEAWKEFSGS